MNRPAWRGKDPSTKQTVASIEQYHDYVHLRENHAGEHQELWYHYHGDRSWLVVTRNTVTHEVILVELAKDVAKAHKAAGL